MRFKPLSSEEIKIGDVLAKYFTQKEWAIYKVVNYKKLSSREVYVWEPLVISDMSNAAWEDQAKATPNIRFFDSKDLRYGEIMKISKNYKDPGVRGMVYEAIKRVFK